MKVKPRPFGVLRGHGNEILSLCFFSLEGDTLLASGDICGHLFLWKVGTVRPLMCTRAHENGILGMEFVNEFLITHGRDGFIRFWTLSCSLNIWEITLEAEIKANNFGFCPSAFFSLGALKFIASACNSTQDVDIYQVTPFQKICCLNQPVLTGPTSSFGMLLNITAFDFQSVFLVFGAYECGLICIWSVSKDLLTSMLDTVSQIPPIVHQHVSSESIVTANFVKKDTVVWGSCGGTSNNAVVLKFQGESLKILHHFVIQSEGISSISFRKDARLVAFSCFDGKIYIQSMKSLKLLAILRFHKSSVHSTVFASEARPFLATAGKDKEICLWDIFA
eukprot:GCRY01001498.1.p1 GENE.GCRY01001498.1~~GCRY01001498.1.p1  ORF type:complete len:335 (-),score=18.85 GCRY01001498.1:141-1145(-)